MIALQLAVGLRVEWCCQDVSDAHQLEPLSISSLVLSATGTSAIADHVPLKLVSQYEAGVVIHHGDQVVVSPSPRPGINRHRWPTSV